MPTRGTPIAVTSMILGHDVALVRVDGELDLQSCPLLAEEIALALRPPAPRHVLADLTGVTFMDSSAIQVLVVAHQHAAGAGTRLSVVANNRAVLRPLDLTNMSAYLDVHHTREAALTHRSPERVPVPGPG